METYQGYVSGIDAQATLSLNPRCQAFITSNPDDEIQVETTYVGLQSALELACMKNVQVEVSIDDTTGPKVLTRVRVLDR